LPSPWPEEVAVPFFFQFLDPHEPAAQVPVNLRFSIWFVDVKRTPVSLAAAQLAKCVTFFSSVTVQAPEVGAIGRVSFPTAPPNRT